MLHASKLLSAAFVGILIVGMTGIEAAGQAVPDSTVVPDSTALPDSTAAQASSAPPARAPRRLSAWTADQRSYQSGDLLTVFLDERTLAMASAGEYARDDRRFGRGVSITPSGRYGARLDGDASSDERGRSQRDERFQTEISVRVVEVVGTAMRVEGTKKFQVDSHQQEVTLRGWVRSQDVDGRNIVEGWRLADLEMLYTSNGELIKPTKGLLQRLMGIVF